MWFDKCVRFTTALLKGMRMKHDNAVTELTYRKGNLNHSSRFFCIFFFLNSVKELEICCFEFQHSHFQKLLCLLMLSALAYPRSACKQAGRLMHMGTEERQCKGWNSGVQCCSAASLASVRPAWVLMEGFPTLISTQSQVLGWNAFKRRKKKYDRLSLFIATGESYERGFRGTSTLLFLCLASR